MHYRALVLAVAGSSSLLVACSGGGSTPSVSPVPGGTTPAAVATSTSAATVPPSPMPSATSTPTATPLPTASPVPAAYPYSNGNTFVYAGTLTQSFTSFPEVVPPGTTSPEPVASSSTNVAQTITVSTGQAFNGTVGLADLRNAETDSLASGLKTTTSTTDSYEAMETTGAAAELLGYGSRYVDESGDTASTLPAPPTILDELPHIAGARWTNGPGATIDEAIAGNAAGSAITTVRTINNDGSYTEKTTYPPDYGATGVTGVGIVQENSDGSGLLSISANGGPTTLTFSPPEPQASGSPLVTINEYASVDTTGTPGQTFQLPSFYGLAPALYSETDRDDGITPVPAACALAPSLPAQATALVQTLARTDTILGYTETTNTTNYVAPGYGLICATMSDTQTSYYDLSGDEPFVFTETPPLEISTTSETLGLQPNSTIAQSAATRHAAGARTIVTPLAGALRAKFDRAVRASRAARLAAFVHRLVTHRSGGLR